MTTYTRSQEQYRQSQIPDDRSLGDLFGDLSQKASTLVRQEVQLAKVEMKQKATEASVEVATITVGGFIANAALLAFTAALVLGLAEFMAPWLAALIVSLGLALVAGLLIAKGVKALREMDPVPEQTVTTLKEDKEWLTQHLNQ
ncbi:MAG: phage holin family protein [Chloroflexota bacterium]